MKRLIALLAIVFFGVTATCGMGFAAEHRPPMPPEQAEQGQRPAHPQKRPPHPAVDKKQDRPHEKDGQPAAPRRPDHKQDRYQKRDGDHRQDGDRRPPEAEKHRQQSRDDEPNRI